MRLLRSTFFWLHLAAGLLAGLVIAVMSFTGAVLAFEGEIVGWAERDLRRVTPPSAEAAALPLDDLITRARDAATDPEADSPPRVTGVTVSADRRDAVAVNLGRDLGVYYVDQYTGEVRPPAATSRTHDFMHLMEDWHRRLARTEAQRDAGRAVTGVANAAFLFLALSGLWLWWPRKWSGRALKPSLWFTGARGKARDWNWHNVYGFWFLPILIVLTATGMVISYRWAGDLAYRVVGETPPAAGPAAAPAQEFKIERPEGAKKLTFAAALARIQAVTPGWTEITLREGLQQRRGGGPAPGQSQALGQGQAQSQPAPASATGLEASPAPAVTGESGRGGNGGERRGGNEGGGRAARGPQPYSATIKADDGTPAFSPSQIVLHPFTGEILSRTGYADQTTGRKIRTWLRFLHTGQAFGWPGQLIAGLACLGGCVLVYTGFALSWRRFFKRRPKPAPAPAAA